MLRFSPLFFLAISSAFASNMQTDTPSQPEIVVTASRVSETIDATLADVSVITRADIDASGARDLIDMLRLQAGIDLVRNGGPGGQTALFLRGTNSNHVLILIDGVRSSSTNTGSYVFEQMPLDAVERIEIVRGPRASYWGSDAIGGVIQIFTRRLDGPRLAVGYGTYRDADSSAGYGSWNGSDGFSVQIGARYVGGFSSQNPAGFSYNPDDDSFRNRNAVLRGNVTFGEQTLGATLFRSQGESAFDQGYSQMIEQTAGVSLAGQLAGGWQHILTVGNAREDYNTPAYFNLYLTRRNTLSWQNEFALSPHQTWIAGLDFTHEQGETRDTYSNAAMYQESRNNGAAFAGWRGRFGDFDSDMAVRHDDNSVFGGATTGSAAAGWQFNSRVRAWLSFGQGFRAPNLNEQFSPGYGGAFAGNPLLRPEHSHSTELGMDFTPAGGSRIGAHLFSTRIQDLISFSGPNYQAENVNRAAIDGAELNVDQQLGAWQAQASYTWQNPRAEDTNTPLLRRPKQKFSATLEHNFNDRLQAGTEVVYAGQRADIGHIVLPTYTILNLRMSYVLNSDLRFIGRLENLTDRNYELLHGYNTPGRSVFLELVWQPTSR